MTTTNNNETVSAAIDRASDSGLMICEQCGAIISAENSGDAVHCDGLDYCGEDCARRADLVQCDECGEWADLLDSYSIEGNWYCSDDCAHNAGYEQCAYCGDWFDTSNGQGVATEWGIYCCDSCAESDGWECCGCCGEWVREARTTATRDRGDVCGDCLDDLFYFCDECDEYVHEDDWNSEADMCDDCARENNYGLLHQYGYTPALTFYGDTCGNSRPYLGVELETDQSGCDYDMRRDYISRLAEIEHFCRVYLTADGSLECGVEVTSHPMTLDEHLGCGLWDEVREAAKESGFTSHDNGRCGLHVHINRSFFGKSYKAQSVGGLNLTMLVGRFERQMMDFARRLDTQWCAFGAHRSYTGNGHMSKCGIFEKADHLDSDIRYSHSVAVNMQHSQTFELRVFRGTLRKRTFNATLALAEGLAQAAKHHAAIWCETCTWYELVGWILDNLDNSEARDDLRAYLAEKGLF